MSFKALKPVTAGDTLKVAVKVKEKHSPKESRGRVVLEFNVSNQRAEGIMQVEGNFLVRQKS